MGEPPLRIAYVDGAVVCVEPEKWADARPFGVDSVLVGIPPRVTQIRAQSVYWCYPEGDDWVFGGGPVGYGELSPEIVLHPSGEQTSRRIEFMPDLQHWQVKVGWWRPE